MIATKPEQATNAKREYVSGDEETYEAREHEEAYIDRTAEQKQPPASPGGTKRQSLLDTLVSSDATLPSAVRSVLRDGTGGNPPPVVDEMTGPGGCKLNFEAPSKQRAGVEAVIEFSLPGNGTVHKDKIFVGNASKRSRFIASCVEAIKGTNAAPNENELRAWLEKRLLKIARDAEVMSEAKSTMREIPIVDGKQRKEATALLKDPSLLYQAGHCLTLQGVVGEQINALLLYLALSSRLLDNLLSCVIKSESSAGKSFLVDNVLKLFPSEAYHFVSGMSRQSLVYSQESFRNKMIVVAEAPGMEASEFNLRTLLSEGRLIFETAEKNEATGRYETRRLEKEGPTGLILTTTKPQLHVENETRYLSLSVDESQAQTRRIMEATARKFERATGAGATPDLTKWINAQRLLRSVKVEVPYSSQLLAKLPAKPLRMRRDSQKLLTAISACALLHQEQRECHGNVIQATLADYYIVKRLLEAVFFGSLHGIPAKTPFCQYE